MDHITSYTISVSEADQRFDRFLRKYFKKYPDIALGDIFRRVRTRSIRVNNRKAKEDYRLQVGDIVSFHFHKIDDRFKVAPTKDAKADLIYMEDIIPLIVYEDEHRIVRNKPAHMVVHAGNDHMDDLSLQDYLRIYVNKKGKEKNEEEVIDDYHNHHNPSTFQPSLCYRLDRDTSGVLVSAVSYQALQYLNEQIRERNVDKIYQAVVVGHAPASRTSDEPLLK
jgi:23S rRNA pseudouridine955/2504/2580 synthase